MTSMGITIFALMTIAIAALFVYFAQYSRFGPTMRKIGGTSPAMAAIFLIFGLNLAFVSNEVWWRPKATRCAHWHGSLNPFVPRSARSS